MPPGIPPRLKHHRGRFLSAYSAHVPIEKGAKFYPYMIYWTVRKDGSIFKGACWWEVWRTYNARGCEKQHYHRAQDLDRRTTLFGR